MKYRKEAARMMVRNGAALMRGSGRNDGGQSRREKKFWFFAWCVVGSSVVPNVVDEVRDA
jgi:hypothetical protein